MTAGAAIGTTQSAINIRIRKLGDRLGQSLMERNARGVRLTRFGSAFLPYARRVLQMHDDAATRAIGSTQESTFELAVSDHTAGRLLSKILGPTRDRWMAGAYPLSLEDRLILLPPSRRGYMMPVSAKLRILAVRAKRSLRTSWSESRRNPFTGRRTNRFRWSSSPAHAPFAMPR